MVHEAKIPTPIGQVFEEGRDQVQSASHTAGLVFFFKLDFLC